jgi:cation transport ATPase
VKLTMDQANACLEMGGAFLRTLDCIKLFQDKRFSGGHLGTALYFLGWGVFNVFFYPSLNQVWSFWAAIVLMVMNGLWFVMALYYNHWVNRTFNIDPRVAAFAVLTVAGVIGWFY